MAPTPAHIILWLETYKYWALFPLAAIEGPIISLVVGFLVSMGYVSFLPAYGILLLGDLIPDTMYYYLGRFGNKRKLMEKYGSRVNIISRNFHVIEKLWEHHGRKTMFLSKLAYGLSTPFLISAGLVNMPLRRFVSYAFPITMLQYAIIMGLGYFLGNSYQLAEGYIQDAGLIVAGVLVVLVAVYVLFSRYARRQVVKMEKEEQPEL